MPRQRRWLCQFVPENRPAILIILRLLNQALLLRIEEMQQAHELKLAQLTAAHADECERLKADLNNGAFLIGRHEQRIRDLENQVRFLFCFVLTRWWE